jgi:hypothetical protein
MVVPPKERRIAFPGWILRADYSASSSGCSSLPPNRSESRCSSAISADPSRSVPLGLYIGGSALIVVTIGGFGGQSISPGYEETTRSDLNMRRMQAMRGAYVLVGLLVIGLGVLCNWLL